MSETFLNATMSHREHLTHSSKRSFRSRRVALGCVGVFLTLATVGCSANYNGERLFWKAEQLNASIAKNPREATPQQFAKAIQAYQTVVAKTPATIWAPRAHLAVGSLYAVQKQYSKAREAFGLVLQNYNQYKELTLSARVAIAKTYEAEQKWDEAIKAYQDVSDYHSWSVPGLEAPLYIARLQEKRQHAEEATSAYERAVKWYSKLLLDAPNAQVALQVKGYLVPTYQRLGRWEDAVATLEDMASAPTGTNRPLVLLTIGAIYQKKLNNLDKARAAYTKLVKEFPDHKFAKVVQAELNRLGPAQKMNESTPVVEQQGTIQLPSLQISGPARATSH